MKESAAHEASFVPRGLGGHVHGSGHGDVLTEGGGNAPACATKCADGSPFTRTNSIEAIVLVIFKL